MSAHIGRDDLIIRYLSEWVLHPESEPADYGTYLYDNTDCITWQIKIFTAGPRLKLIKRSWKLQF